MQLRGRNQRGEPGYGPHLDRDNDGVGCEPYRGR
ncbi:MAG: excalibur calcium-binding domain-containing protein [Pseudoxanthomonas sp.]|nr:excalibur calcium-binding domain-containing protein [Pseudoxanthomonas sp.]